jgi:hypothetical protein
MARVAGRGRLGCYRSGGSGGFGGEDGDGLCLDRGVVDTLGRFNDGERSTASVGAVGGWTESLSSRDLVTVISNGNSKVAQGTDAEPFVHHGFV